MRFENGLKQMIEGIERYTRKVQMSQAFAQFKIRYEAAKQEEIIK
jgi:hypothetical protein